MSAERAKSGGTGAPGVTWREAGQVRQARWLSLVSPPPGRLGLAGDETSAAQALARVRAGEALLYRGDYVLARQLLAAMGRRLRRPGPVRGRSPQGGAAPSPADLFRRERERSRLEHVLLSRLLVPVEAGWRVPLRRAPDLRAACEEALGGWPSFDAAGGAPVDEAGEMGVLPLRDLLGLVGAHEWRRRGLEVPALGARLHPHHGVYAPIRGEYVDLVAAAAPAGSLSGKRALEVGTGTGVLAILLARAGARVVATDLEPAAVACARENAAALGAAEAIEVVEADLFPPRSAPGSGDDRFDLVVANPPWLPAAAHTPLDRAVYDPGGAFLARFLAGAPARLAPGGEVWLVLSDLAERLGLRAPGAVEAAAAAAGLRLLALHSARPAHPRARDAGDPLHAFRAAEVTRLFRFGG